MTQRPFGVVQCRLKLSMTALCCSPFRGNFCTDLWAREISYPRAFALAIAPIEPGKACNTSEHDDEHNEFSHLIAPIAVEQSP
jgi:hypothetical protein